MERIGAGTGTLSLARACLQCQKTQCVCPGSDNRLDPAIVVSAQYDVYISQQVLNAPPINVLDSLRSKYVFQLRNAQLKARFWLMSGGFDDDTTLALAVPRVGYNTALDNAVRCVSESEDVACQQSYVTALNSLRSGLYDPVLSRSEEVLAAANILYNHEIYINPLSSNWTTHANGLVQLLRFRGPQSMQSDLERSVLIGNIGTIFLMAATLRQPCFLAEPDWTATIRETIVQLNECTDDTFPEDFERLILASLHLPGLLLRYESTARSLDLEDLPQYISEVSSLRSELQECRRQHENAEQFRSLEEEIAHALNMPVTATSRMSADVFLIVLDYMLFNLRSSCGPGQSASIEVPSGNLNTVNYWTLLASKAKIKWLGLTQLDTISARACAAGVRAVIAWVLDPPFVESAEVQTIRLILQDLRRCLKP